MYNYVKQEMELFRANGAWPDLVSIGNEVNNGMFNTTGADGLSPSGTNCTPTATAGGTGTANCFPRIQRAAMQAIADAASDRSDPALLGRPLPPPLTCIHVDGNPDLQGFFDGAVNTNGIPLDVACESYYPGWHGPLTEAQQTWHPCNTFGDCGSTVQHIAQDDFAGEANGLGLPIFTIEDGVSYTTQGSPQDPWYGINPPGPSRDAIAPGDHRPQQGRGEHPPPSQPGHGMVGRRGDTDSGRQLRRARVLGHAGHRPVRRVHHRRQPVGQRYAARDGGDGRPARPHARVQAGERGRPEACWRARGKSTALDTGPDTGITGPQQQWRLLAQGADPEQNSATYPTPMDHRGDGYFQIANMDRANGVNVLDTHGTHVTQSPQAADVFAIAGTDPNQEWDILPRATAVTFRRTAPHRRRSPTVMAITT